MADQLSLEILIKTIADTRGIVTTKDQVAALAKEMDAAAAATGRLDTSADKIAASLQGAGKAAETSTQATDTFGRALERIEKQGSGVTDQMKEQAKETLRNIDATDRNAKSAESLAKSLNGAKLGFSGVRDVVSGGLNGNLLQVGEGFLKISKASAEATPRLASLFAQLARGAGAGAAVAAPLAIATAAVNQYADDVIAANQRILDNAASSAAQRKKLLEEETAAVVAEYAKQIKAANDAATAAEEAQKRIDASYSRADKKRDPERSLRDTTLDIEEKRALEKAATPEQREKISRDFARRRDANKASDQFADLNTSDFEGATKTRAAEEAIRAAQQRNDELRAGVSSAEIDYENKRSAAASFGASDTGVAAERARKEAFDAKAKLETARGKADEGYEANSNVIQTQQAIIDQAKDTKEIVAIQREILKATLAQKSHESSGKGATSEDKKDAAAIDAVIAQDVAAPATKSKGSGGTITRGGQTYAVSDSASVERAVNAAGSAIATTLDSVGKFAKTVSDKSAKLDERLAIERERAAGG